MAAMEILPPTAVPEKEPEAAPGLPDVAADPNAVLKDQVDSWRYGRAPDYTKTRQYWQETKSRSHADGSLEQIVENLVKNWEVEASFKTDFKDWRTVDQNKYTFAMNGGPEQSGEHMLKVGTYNAIIASNSLYAPAKNDFSSSHKTFKRMMPHFAWEVLEVYSGPPVVSFRWRHWGVMKNDYVGFNEAGEKVTAKSHGGTIDIQGVTVATVNDKLQVEKLHTWFDSMEMFRQIAPQGIINKENVGQESAEADKPTTGVEDAKAAGVDAVKEASNPGTAGGIPNSKPEDERANSSIPDQSTPATMRSTQDAMIEGSKPSIYTSSVSGYEEPMKPSMTGSEDPSAEPDQWEEALEAPASEIHPFSHDVEDKIKPGPGEAVVANPHSAETLAAYAEMSKVTPMECPFMNKE